MSYSPIDWIQGVSYVVLTHRRMGHMNCMTMGLMKYIIPESQLKQTQMKVNTLVKFSGITLFVVFALSTSVCDASTFCARLFVNLSASERHELVKKRALAIIDHQNKLREETGLPVFTKKDYESNLKRKPPQTITSNKRYRVVDSKLVLIGLDETMTLTALKTDDVHSFNYVYRFKGAELIEAIPATKYYLSQMGEIITLHRVLSAEEAQYWADGNLAALRSHPKSIKWGYHEPVAHFSMVHFHSHMYPTISAHIPREVLLRWAEEKLITIGSEGDLNGKPYRIEIVIKDEAWEELLNYLE